MSEPAWESLSVQDLLAAVPEISERKLRLFACACVRRLPSARSGSGERAIQIAERYADGNANAHDLAAARYGGRFLPGHPAWAVCWPPKEDAWAMTERALTWVAGFILGSAHFVNYRREERAQAAILREIIGNPFDPCVIDPAWLIWNDRTIPQLATAMYEDRDMTRMPILGDALEEAGCTDGRILEHCRTAGEHVLGCWLLDLCLGLK